ncbi:MAG: ribbon-helix-helix domain-containing protein [Deltaproteobacteria bacterium]|nr:ribbon-helix-helix domain-containing protein [Deltaproteobacteria bacterium]
MPRKKITTTIYITPEQNEKLKLLHDKTKVPVAEYIRQGIDLVLERNSEALPRQLSFLETTTFFPNGLNGKLPV